MTLIRTIRMLKRLLPESYLIFNNGFKIQRLLKFSEIRLTVKKKGATIKSHYSKEDLCHSQIHCSYLGPSQ